MRFGYFTLICLVMPFISGVSGCDSRAKFGLYKYVFTECPSDNFSLPSQIKFSEWEFKADKPEIACNSFNHYFMTDAKWRTGGLGLPKANGVYAKFAKDGLTCSIDLIFQFDITDSNPEEHAKLHAQTAAMALTQQANTKIEMPAKSFEILGKKEDYERWCSIK